MSELLIDALAVFRIWRLIAEDQILEDVRSKWEAWAADHFSPPPEPGHTSATPKIVTLVGCPWCLGFWLCIAAVAARRYAPALWAPIARIFAASALVGATAEILYRIDR